MPILTGSVTYSSGDYDFTTATILAGATVLVDGTATLEVNGIAASALSTITAANGGVVTLEPGLAVNALTTYSVGNGGTLALATGTSVGLLSSVSFDTTPGNPGGLLEVPEAVLTSGSTQTVDGIGPTDSISITGGSDIANVQYVYSPGIAGVGAVSQLVFTNGSGTEVGAINLGGNYTGATFGGAVVNGNYVVSETACYVEGTLIETPSGEVPIEALRIGDLVRTASGEARPVRWIGRRAYARPFIAQNPDVQPVLFAMGALANGIPRRDLQVSPQHAMLLDGVLVEARLLVNDVTIRRAEPADHIAYYNVELETHDAIIAEGAASETFLDRDSRNMFQNAAEYHALYPDAVPGEPVFCARRVEDGATLAAIRARLDDRAGLTAARGAVAAAGPLASALDRCDRRVVAGWACAPETPDVPVIVEILVDGATVARLVANRLRPDLAEAGFGRGYCSFSVALPEALSADADHLVEVRRVTDGTALEGSPVLLTAAPRRAGIAAGLAALDLSEPEAAEAAIGFLLARTEAHLTARARSQGQHRERTERFWMHTDLAELPNGQDHVAA